MKAPVLLVHFNRYYSTRLQLEVLQEIVPKRVLILSDGPQPRMADQIGCVNKFRALLDELPWRCKVPRFYRTKNWGCFRLICEGLDWIFHDVQQVLY